MSKSYECQICHYVYSKLTGEPLADVVAGTTWEQIGEDFKCPHCHANKKMFREALE